MVIARSGARFLSSAASTRAARWRASLSGSWWESRNSRAAEGPGPIAVSHQTAKIAQSERRMPLPLPNMLGGEPAKGSIAPSATPSTSPAAPTKWAKCG